MPRKKKIPTEGPSGPKKTSKKFNEKDVSKRIDNFNRDVRIAVDFVAKKHGFCSPTASVLCTVLTDEGMQKVSTKSGTGSMAANAGYTMINGTDDLFREEHVDGLLDSIEKATNTLRVQRIKANLKKLIRNGGDEDTIEKFAKELDKFNEKK